MKRRLNLRILGDPAPAVRAGAALAVAALTVPLTVALGSTAQAASALRAPRPRSVPEAGGEVPRPAGGRQAVGRRLQGDPCLPDQARHHPEHRLRRARHLGRDGPDEQAEGRRAQPQQGRQVPHQQGPDSLRRPDAASSAGSRTARSSSTGRCRSARAATGTRPAPARRRSTGATSTMCRRIYDVPMPYSQFFDGGQAFHSISGSMWSPPGSHGCVNMTQRRRQEVLVAAEER